MAGGNGGLGRAGVGTGRGGGQGRDFVMFVDETGRAQQTRPELREIIGMPSGGTAEGDEVCVVRKELHA